MEQHTIRIMNWFCLLLLVPALLVLVWNLVSTIARGQRISFDLITASLVFASAVIGILQLNFDKIGTWSGLVFSAIQLVIIVLLVKRLWSPMKQKLLE